MPHIAVDAHHHFWDPANGDFPWMAGDAMTPLHLEIIGSTAQLTLMRNSLARGITLVVECTDDLVLWTPLATSVSGNAPTGPAMINEGSGIIRTVTVQHAIGLAPTFYRLRVTLP